MSANPFYVVIDGLNLFLDLHIHTCIHSYTQAPFIHSYIKSNSNSAISSISSSRNTIVKPQFTLQHSFKFAPFYNATVLQMSNIFPSADRRWT